MCGRSGVDFPVGQFRMLSGMSKGLAVVAAPADVTTTTPKMSAVSRKRFISASEGRAERAENGRVAIRELKEVEPAGAELGRAEDRELHGPARVPDDRGARAGKMEDAPPRGRLCRRVEIAGNGQDVDPRVRLRVRNNRAIQRVAELPEGVMVMEDPADQVPVRVELLPHGVVVGAGVEDVERIRAAAADDAAIDRAV